MTRFFCSGPQKDTPQRERCFCCRQVAACHELWSHLLYFKWHARTLPCQPPHTSHIFYSLIRSEKSHIMKGTSHAKGGWHQAGVRLFCNVRGASAEQEGRCHVRSHATTLLQTTMCDAWISSGGDNWRTGIWAPSSQLLAKCIREKIWIKIRIKLFWKSQIEIIKF